MAKGKSIVLWEIILIESVCEIFDLSLCYTKQKKNKKIEEEDDGKCEAISDYIQKKVAHFFFDDDVVFIYMHPVIE